MNEDAFAYLDEMNGQGRIEYDDYRNLHDLISVAQEPSADEGKPTERTSNHGWAIWHLTQAKQATSVAEAQMHAACANARAQLQVSCEMGAQRGVDPNGPTLWQEEWA